MPEMGVAVKRSICEKPASMSIHTPSPQSAHGTRAADQNPILRITKRGSNRITSMTSAQMRGA